MLGRAWRFLLRLIGWLLTPLVVTATAIGGATLGFMVVGHWSATLTTAAVAFGFGIAGAITGTLLWIRLLRQSPRLREALAVTETGLPEPEAVHEMLQSVTLEDKPTPSEPPT